MLIGSQTPTYKTGPSNTRSMGADATAFAATAGLYMDPWQASVLDDAMGYRRATPDEMWMHPDGMDWRWTAPEVGMIVPRQNGKGSALEAMTLYALFNIPDVQLILWSAHEFKTAREAFLRIKTLVENTPHLMRHVKPHGIYTAAGNEGIELHHATKDDKCACNGSRLRFVARSQTSGRGFSGDVIILDEAFELSDEALAALLFTLGARPNPQIWYTSSAPLVTSVVLRRVCKRGRRGSEGLAYAEWCADKKDELTDRDAWAKANPGLGIRLSETFTQKEYDATDSEDFQRERLGVWSEEAFESIIDLGIWNKLEVEEDVSTTGATTAFAVDTTPDRKYSAIVAASFHEGSVLVEVIDVLPGTKWLAPRLVDLTYSHDPCIILIDSQGPAKAIKQDLKANGIYEIDTDGPEKDEGKILLMANTDIVVRACGSFYDAIMDDDAFGTLRHLGDEELNSAIEGADTRPVGEGWVWSRKNSAVNIAPLTGACLAFYGIREYGEGEEEMIPFAFFSSN